jgi:hypothetical protein
MLHQELTVFLDAKYDPNKINPQPEKAILHNLKNVNLKKEKKMKRISIALHFIGKKRN